MNSACRCCFFGVMVLSLSFALMLPGCGSDSYDQSSSTPSSPAATEPTPSPSPKSPPVANLPVWEPDSALVKQLGSYQEVEDYEIRVPTGYKPAPLPPSNAIPPNGKVFGWWGPPQENNSRSTLVVMLLTIPPQQARKTSLEHILKLMLPPVALRGPNFQVDPAERGRINDLSFLRASYQDVSFPGPSGQVKGRGLTYVGKIGNTAIVMMFGNQELHHKESLKLGTAAIMTFRKKP